MGLFSETVPREQYEDMKRARDAWQAECALLRSELTAAYKEVVAVKRHELGLPPAGFEPKDPTAILGPKTRAAIEQMSGGFADQRSYLTNWAVTQAAAQGDTEGADEQIAFQIRQGDTE